MQYPIKNPRVSQGFGGNAAYYSQFGQKGHNGIDFACPTGTPVYAADAGVVYFEGWGKNSSWMGSISGICAIIDHGTVYTGYAHLKYTVISKGQRVKRGQLIGYTDSTGISTGPHLHFELIGKPPKWSNGYAARIKPPAMTLIPSAVATVKKTVSVVKKVVAPKKYYIVKPGDYAIKIASAYKISLATLKALNPQVKNINVIYAGQALRVK